MGSRCCASAHSSYQWGTNDCDGADSQSCALELQNDDGQVVVLAAPTFTGSVYLQAGTWTGVPGLGGGSQFTPDQMPTDWSLTLNPTS